MEVTISPSIPELSYLKAIQSLNGQKPGEKYRYLNALVQSIVKVCQETGVSSEDVIKARQQEIPATLLPLVRILTGIELKSTEAVVEALRSSDIVVVNKALRAKWFFDGSSPVEAPYFMENIFPFVSVRTRLAIVKALTRGLYNADNAEGKAENFFNSFYDMFGLEESMPFLPYCGEKFLFECILKFKIVLTLKILDIIFQRYPKLAIRYLYLGCSTVCDNEADRKVHTITVSSYTKFFPKLIKNHISDYINLIRFSNNNKIGSTRTRALFKKAKYCEIIMIESNSRTWPIKYIYHHLSKEQFETYYASLHPKKIHNYNFSKMFEYLKYYPKASRIDFMKDQYERFYNKDFFSNLHSSINMSTITDLFNNGQINEEQLEALYSSVFEVVSRRYNSTTNDLVLNLKNYSSEKMLNMLHKCVKKKHNLDLDEVSEMTTEEIIEYFASEKYLLLLSGEEKMKKAQSLIATYKTRNSDYYKWCCFLPPEQSFGIFKSGAECSNARKRVDFLKKMIYSCKIYNNQTYLTKVLKYYIQRHKNEQSSTLHSFLEYFIQQFDILTLNDENWHLFFEFIETAYIKNELFNARLELVEKIFELSMCRLSTESEEQMQDGESISLDAMIHKYLEFKIVYQDHTVWTIFETLPELEDKFIKLFMYHIPIKYPENHLIWRDGDKKVKVGIKIISKLHNRNQNILSALTAEERRLFKERKQSDLNSKITRVVDYTWLREISEQLLRQSNSKHPTYLESFKTLMKEYDEEFYLSVIPNIADNVTEKNILFGKARSTLKNNCRLILDCWEEYLGAARNLLQSKSQSGARAAKHFILSTKWHQQLPLMFVERCVAEIDRPGSMIILALLLDGETLSKILSNFIPSGPTVDICKAGAKENYQIISYIPAAVNISVPYVSTEILMSMFQNEYTKFGQRSVKNFGQRVDKISAINFAKQLMNKPVSVEKHGIRLMFSVFTNNEISEYLTESSQIERHPTVNVIIAHRIFNLFIKCPSDRTWNTINNFFDGLRCKDLLALKILSNIKLICNPYASLYLKKLLSKIENLYEEPNRMDTDQVVGVNDSNKKLGLNVKTTSLKEDLIRAVFENVTEESVRFLSKETILDILQRYYFRSDSRSTRLSSITFANKIFCRHFKLVSECIA